MKVVCLISSLQLGGAERQLSGLAVMLKGCGADVEVLTYKDGDFYEEYLRSEGVEHVFIRKRGDLRLVRDIASHLKDAGCDVLISFLAGTNIKACLIHKLYPSFRLIVSERIFNTRFMPHDLLRFLLYREAFAVVCNNHSQEGFIRRHASALAPGLVTIPNFVDTDLFAPGDCARRTDAPVIIVTARLSARKNPGGLVRAAGILKREGLEFTVRWFGVTSRDARRLEVLESLCRDEDVEDRFHFLPASRSVAEEYRASDIFCLPSFYEGTSNSLAEAMSSALVPVCSRVGDNVRYVTDGVNGFLFDPHDAGSIADALRRAIKPGHDGRTEYGARCRELAVEMLGKNAFRKAWTALLGMD